MAARSVVRLGYVRTTYPVLNDCVLRTNWTHLCHLPGIAMEMWKELSKKLNFDIELVHVPEGYGSLVNGVWTGMIGLLANGSIDATVGFIAFSPERYQVIRYSVPLSQWDNGFVTQQPVGSNLKLLLQGYSNIVLFLMTIFFVVVSLFEWHRLGTASDAAWSSLSALFFQLSSDSRVLRNPLMIFGWLGVAIGYFAGFRSQTITFGFVSPPFETMSEARRKFGTGALTLLISHSAVSVEPVYPNPAQEHPPPLVVSMGESTAQLLCTNRNLVYFGDTGALGSIWLVNSPCRLQRVPVLDHAIGMGSNYLAIGFRRKFPQYHRVNRILLRLFSIDQIESYWANKYLSQFPQHGYAKERYFLPISFIALLPAYYLLISGFCFALLVAICERKVTRFI